MATAAAEGVVARWPRSASEIMVDFAAPGLQRVASPNQSMVQYIELHFALLPVMSDEEEDDLGIKPGTVIDSSKANYVVIKLLGEGGFGAVFK
ncbi:hypothetical protein Y032_0026g1304 [Ancylostoma ceylanicum]|nr:hypothetical protein Y032_0026g1304 [Ancylostoma ceylanicum]